MRFVDRLISKSIYTRAHFQLELDGERVGLIKSIEGGAIKAEAMSYQDGADRVPRRLRGRTKYEDLRINGGIAMGLPFLNWMGEFMAGKVVRRNGAIDIADFDGFIRARREFYGAMITEVGFPKFDAEDKTSNVYLNVSLAPEAVTFQEFKDKKPRRIKGHDDTVGHRAAKANSFVFSFDGHEDWCRRVTKVDAFSIKQKVTEYVDNNPKGMHQLGNGDSMGAPAVARKLPGKIELPSSISVYMPEIDSFALAKRVQEGLARGDGSDVIAGARLVARDPEQSELFEISFLRLHVLGITVDGSGADADSIKQVKVEFVPEQISFSPNRDPAKQGARLSEASEKRLRDAVQKAMRDTARATANNALGKTGGQAVDKMLGELFKK